MDDPESSPIDLAPKPRRRFRFGLRGLIVLVTLAAIVFAPFGMITRRKQREQRGVSMLTDAGAFVVRGRSRSRLDSICHFFIGAPWHVVFRSPHVWMPDAVMLRSSSSQVYSPIARIAELADEQMPRVVLGVQCLGNVEFLFLESAALTDDGLVELCQAPIVGQLDLRCPLVTSRGTDALQQKFPKLVILDD